ncbi:hypothetical protein DFR86_03445 [Acidianus sulfidivorans JP7]|uniref:Uncharacterized protein n=1 Tax=Acidianus sulfidivorans JP7 TaxID=619593 RepID=A0A2U9IL12_9CREN|nr:hypothetical protein [Acidianus sulfidivorans]AWR96703.1 hypothetical protein DFR86_03445 [Acidianus sulfidivorans JP7]
MVKNLRKDLLYSILIGLLPFLSIRVHNDYLMLFSFILSLFILLLFNYEIRVLIVIGIFSLVSSAFFDRIVLGDFAYFYFVFGVIGIIISDKLRNKNTNQLETGNIKEGNKIGNMKEGNKKVEGKGKQKFRIKLNRINYLEILSWIFVILSLPFMFDMWYFAFAKGSLHLDIVFIGAGLLLVGFIIKTLRTE